jgi:hypothetical protein
MPLPVVCPGLFAQCLLPVEFPFLLLLPACGLPLEAHAHLVHAVTYALDDVEAVYHYHGVGKALLHNGLHGVREVHRHFFHRLALLLRNPPQLFRHILRLRAADGGDERAASAVPVLVGEEREQVLAVQALVYAQMVARVFRQEHPVRGMFQPVYCDVKGYNFWGVGKVKVILDLGSVTEGKGSFEGIYDEKDKPMKFNTMIDALNYLGKRGWKVVTTYILTEGFTKQNVIHYMMVKSVTNDSEIREGLTTKPEE